MDISWRSASAGICVETHFAFLISALLCSLTLWGFTVSLFPSARLLPCNLTAPERTLKLWSVHILILCFHFLVALVHVNVFQRQSPQSDAKWICASFLCIATVLYTKINLCTKHNTHSTTAVSLPHGVHLSRKFIHLTRTSAVISSWKILICNYYTKDELPLLELMWALSLSHRARHGYWAIRHFFPFFFFFYWKYNSRENLMYNEVFDSVPGRRAAKHSF